MCCALELDARRYGLRSHKWNVDGARRHGGAIAFTTASPTQNFSNLYSTGATYSVSIVTQPAGQTCSLGPNSSGVILANTVVTATCAAAGNTFTIGGILYDLSANPSSSGVILQDNAADDLTLHLNGTFTFATALASGSAYDVTVSLQPATPDQKLHGAQRYRNGNRECH